MEMIKNNHEFETLIHKNKLSLVYFSRLWCGVCHALKPQVETILKQYPEVALAEVNIDDQPEIGAQQTIFSVPAFILFYEGKEFMRQAGYLKLDQLQDVLNRFRNLEEEGE